MMKRTSQTVRLSLSCLHIQNETELEAIFLHNCISRDAKEQAYRGGKEQAYHGMVAAGENAATLHHVKNNEPITNQLNLLLDGRGCCGHSHSGIFLLWPLGLLSLFWPLRDPLLVLATPGSIILLQSLSRSSWAGHSGLLFLCRPLVFKNGTALGLLLLAAK